jgi:AcrR family transcriptional regulator
MDAQKDQIADAFQRHFNHFGMKKTSMDEIARELRISKKTIYQHFSTKEQVFYYVVSRIAAQYRARMEQELEEFPTYRGKFEQLIRLIFKESRRWLKKSDAFEFKYKYEIAELAFQDTYTDLIANLMQKGIVAGEFTPQPVEIATRFVRGIISQSMEMLTAQPDQPVEDSTVAAIFKLLQ